VPDLALETERLLSYQGGMTITLHPDQEAWLKRRAASGDFDSVEAAARQLLGERIAQLDEGEDGASDDAAWMKPHIDKGLAALDRGDFVTLEEHKAHNAALLASLED
jgi:antitoxin ParD1/3/4